MGNYPVTFETLLIAPNVCCAVKKQESISPSCCEVLLFLSEFQITVTSCSDK